jgi:hypothetical protein
VIETQPYSGPMESSVVETLLAVECFMCKGKPQVTTCAQCDGTGMVGGLRSATVLLPKKVPDEVAQLVQYRMGLGLSVRQAAEILGITPTQMGHLRGLAGHAWLGAPGAGRACARHAGPRADVEVRHAAPRPHRTQPCGSAP